MPLLSRSFCASVALACALTAVPALAVPVADFRDDFRTGTPMPGWTYQWNDNAAIGNVAEYAPLQGAPNGTYQANGDAAYPDPAPASFTVLGLDPAAPAGLPQTFLRPGQGTGQAADGI